MRALITARFTDEGLAILQPLVKDIRLGGWGQTLQRLTPEELVLACEDVEILVVEFEPITAEVLEALPGLKVVGCCRNEPAANVDIAAATARRLPVLHTPGRNAVSVAEFTFGLMLALARHIAKSYYLFKWTDELVVAEHHKREGYSLHGAPSEWSLDKDVPFMRFRGPELAGKKLGLVGLGSIGREVARRARCFDMDLLVYDPYVGQEVLASLRAKAVDLETLLREADFVSINCKVTPETKGMIGARELNLMKPTACLINTARAVLVDTEALCQALREGRIAGAAVDVFDEEPVQADHPLLQLDNVVATPHIAGASQDVIRRQSVMIAEDLARFLTGQRPRFVANPEVLEAGYHNPPES